MHAAPHLLIQPTILHADSQAEVASLLQRLQIMFPEGLGRAKRGPRDGLACPMINMLIVNAKAAVDEFWKVRGYVTLKPDEIKGKLGFRLDREEAMGHVVTSALHLPLLSGDEARVIGKRASGMLGAKGAIGKPLASLTKRGVSTVQLLQAKASLSLAPPKKTCATTKHPPGQLPQPPPQPPEPQPGLPPELESTWFVPPPPSPMHL